jgi:HEAT repeat protein
MTRTTLLAACIAATSFLPAVARAQTELPTPSLDRARELYAGGRPMEAMAVLRQLPPSADASQLRVDISLSVEDFPLAMRAYDELTSQLKSPAPDVLRAIATRRTVTLRQHADPEVRVAACEALLLSGTAPDCIVDLLRTANDASASFDSRLTAARVLVEHKAQGASALLDTVIADAIANSPVTCASALAQMPAAVSNEPLKRLLASSNADAQYLAALALTRRRLPDTVAPLRSVANDPEAGAARLMAYIGLAALGEPDGLRILRETLPLMKGRDRLEAARALSTIKDAEGPKILASLLMADAEMLRIETAELVYASQPGEASAALTAGIESSNEWIRAAAIAAAGRVGMPLTRGVQGAIADPSPRVALAAARRILSDGRPRR